MRAAASFDFYLCQAAHAGCGQRTLSTPPLPASQWTARPLSFPAVRMIAAPSLPQASPYCQNFNFCRSSRPARFSKAKVRGGSAARFFSLRLTTNLPRFSACGAFRLIKGSRKGSHYWEPFASFLFICVECGSEHGRHFVCCFFRCEQLCLIAELEQP